MKFWFVLLLFVFFSNRIWSQQTSRGVKSLNLTIGSSKHFSGDISGIAFTTEYAKNFKKRLSYSIGLTGTIHDGEFPLFYTSPSGREIDGSIRYVTAGVQINGHLGYHLISTLQNNLQLKFGPLIRHQSSSLPDAVGITYPIATGYPIPVVDFEHLEPQRIVTVGGSLQIRYDYIFNNKMTFGILGGFQIDSNGDNIAQVSLSVGRRF